MKRVPRSAFSLLEVLVAIAIFGLAAAALFMALGPTYDALFRLSNATNDEGDLEIVKAFVEATQDRSTLAGGGTRQLPGGGEASWAADVSPTDTEALFLVRLTLTRTDGTSVVSNYLHFEPLWMDASSGPPKWLPHTGGGIAGGGGNGRGNNRNGGNNGNGRGGQNGGNNQNGQKGPGGAAGALKTAPVPAIPGAAMADRVVVRAVRSEAVDDETPLQTQDVRHASSSRVYVGRDAHGHRVARRHARGGGRDPFQGRQRVVRAGG